MSNTGFCSHDKWQYYDETYRQDLWLDVQVVGKTGSILFGNVRGPLKHFLQTVGLSIREDGSSIPRRILHSPNTGFQERAFAFANCFYLQFICDGNYFFNVLGL